MKKHDDFDDQMRLGDIPQPAGDYGKDGEELQEPDALPDVVDPHQTNPGHTRARQRFEERDTNKVPAIDDRAIDRAGGVRRADLWILAVLLAAWELALHVYFAR